MSQAIPSDPFLDQDRRVREELLRRFDEAWHSGKPPRIEDFLPPAAASATLRRTTLEELFRIDLEYRWRNKTTAGQPGALEHYIARYPDLGTRETLTPDLIAYEYRVRQQWGDRPGHDEYAGRFPRQWTELRETLRRIDAELAAEFAVQARRPASPPLPGPSGEPADSLSVAALLDAIRRAELLSPAQWDELTRSGSAARFADARTLARELLRRDWLTPFQVNQLFQGRGHELVLGPYLVLERLGAGGAGQVFKARHRNMARTVALKLIRKELLVDPEIVSRFYREMQLLGSLSHPHIVHALDAGPVGPIHLLAMEYVEGTDLGKLVKDKGPLPVTQACDYIRQAACGLAHAHEKGLVHRDIKPSNLILASGARKPPVESPVADPATEGLRPPLAGTVKILDLGLARLQRKVNDDQTLPVTDPHSTHTLTPVGGVLMMGTPDYLAPEQAVNFHGADIRADIYSLGCTLYFLLTGQPPFPGGTLAEKLWRHQQKEPPPLRQFCPELPRGLELVLARMLAKQPEDRYQNPAEVAAALEPFCHGDTIRTRVPRLPPISRRTFCRAGAGVAALTGGFLLFRSFQSNPTADPDKDRPPPPSELLFAGKPSELVAVLGTRRLHPWGEVLGVAFSPDGKIVASLTATGEDITLWDVQTGWEKSILKHKDKGPFTRIGLPPDGKTLISLGSPKGEILFWDIHQGTIRETFPETGISQMALSPDGTLLAVSVPDPQGKGRWRVKLWRSDDLRKPVADFAGHGAYKTVIRLAFAPDGKSPVSVGQDLMIKVWDVATVKERSSFPMPSKGNWLAYSPDGNTLVATSVGSWVVPCKLTLWDVEKTGSPRTAEPRTLEVGMNQIDSVAFAPDGRTVAFGVGASKEERVHVWDMAAGKERELKEWSGPAKNLQKPDQRGGSLAFTPDGQSLAWGSAGAVVLWNPADRKERTFGSGHTRGVVAVAFAPDGNTLASAGRDGKVVLWDPTSGHLQRDFEAASGEMNCLAYSHDSAWLAYTGTNTGVVLWHPVVGKRLHFRGLSFGADVVALSQDGGLVAAGNTNGDILVWDRAKGEAVAKPWKGATSCLAFAPDGNVLASGGRVIQLWQARTGRELAALPGTDLAVTALWFAPDGKTLASAGTDGVIRRFDLAARKQLSASPPESSVFISCVAFAPDGQTLVEGCHGGLLLQRKVPSGEAVWRCQLPGTVRGVAFSPDGRRVATANDNSTVYVLRLPAARR